MKIGVIVPYYTPDQHTQELFERCKASIDDRFEKIFVDSNKLGKGVSFSRNYGLDIAARMDLDYITFMDADDVMLPEAYDNLRGAIREFKQAQIIQLNHKRRKPDGTVWTKFFNTDRVFTVPSLPSLWMVVWNKVYKADLIERIRFKPGLRHGEDEIFNLRCLAKARKIHCSSMFHMMHCFDNPESLSKIVDIDDLIAEQRELLEFVADYSDDRVMCEIVRQRQAELWENCVYKATFSKDGTK